MKNKILIISYDETFKNVLKTELEKLEIEILTASDGINGLNMARKSEPGVIITDTTLPHLSGFHMCRLLKNDDRYKKTPVVFLSNNDDNQTILESKRAGGDLFLRKPIQVEILIDELIRLLTSNKLTHAV